LEVIKFRIHLTLTFDLGSCFRVCFL